MPLYKQVSESVTQSISNACMVYREGQFTNFVTLITWKKPDIPSMTDVTVSEKAAADWGK